MGESGELTYYYDPEQATTEPVLKEGATDGWLVWHDGVGPGRAMRVVALTDGDGNGFIDFNGDWQDVTIYDDTPTPGD